MGYTITHTDANGITTDVPGENITLHDLLQMLAANGESITIKRIE